MRDPACKRGRLLSVQVNQTACMRGPASTWGPASNRSFTVYVYEMNTRQRTKGGTYINTTVQLQQFPCYCGAILMHPFIRLLKQSKKILGQWAIGGWGVRLL